MRQYAKTENEQEKDGEYQKHQHIQKKANAKAFVVPWTKANFSKEEICGSITGQDGHVAKPQNIVALTLNAKENIGCIFRALFHDWIQENNKELLRLVSKYTV